MEIIHDHGYSFAESDDIVMSVLKIEALVIHLAEIHEIYYLTVIFSK